jgi:hypothetical protein
VTDTLTRTDWPKLAWRSEHMGTHLAQRMTAPTLRSLLQRDGYMKRNATVVDAYTVEARTLDGKGGKTTWLGSIPDPADRHAAVDSLLAQWVDLGMPVAHLHRLERILRGHVDEKSTTDVLDQLIATGAR